MRNNQRHIQGRRFCQNQTNPLGEIVQLVLRIRMVHRIQNRDRFGTICILDHKTAIAHVGRKTIAA